MRIKNRALRLLTQNSLVGYEKMGKPFGSVKDSLVLLFLHLLYKIYIEIIMFRVHGDSWQRLGAKDSFAALDLYPFNQATAEWLLGTPGT